ncbi:MAG: aminoacyltransferase [Oligoflexia bacterium]|nr:aminoacyltransferase [Oligoflexia bacterium]
MGLALPIVPSPALLESGQAFFTFQPACELKAQEGPLQIDLTLRSAVSLALIAQWFGELRERTPVVWLPNYFCNSSLGPLRKAGANLTFYPLNASLEPDYSWCREHAEHTAPDIFVLVHFFGYASNAGEALRFSEQFKSVLVEDAAHCMSFTAQIGAKGAFALRSPHKLVAAPHGALVRFDPARLKFWPEQLQQRAQALWRDKLTQLPQSRDLPIAWLCKRTLQQLIGGRLPAVNFDPALDRIPAVNTPVQRPSRGVLQLLVAAQNQVAAICDRRWENFRIWEESIGAWGLSPGWSELRGRLGCPYLFPFTAADPHSLHAGVRRLQSAGVPVMSWPDLPPEVLADPVAHAGALALRSKMYFLPVHQGLTPWALAQKSTAHRTARIRLPKVEFLELDREAWDLKVSRAQFPSLLQSSAWAEAKRREGWDCRRVNATLRGEEVALIQILKRRRGPLLVQRINRAPLLLHALNPADLEALYRAVAELAGVFKGTVLSIAPPLEFGAQHLGILKAAGFRPNFRSRRPWISSSIDLTRSEEELRAGLEKKWRASLKKAAGEGLQVVSSSEKARVGDFLLRYQEFVAKRSFDGVPVPLLEDLYEAGKEQDLLLVLDAELEGGAVASVCIAQHAGVSTYLAGFADEEGRRKQASYLLLWEAILLSKRAGMRYFDLGGTDAVLTPEIAAFKRGLGGKEYRLVGEFYRI